MTKLLELTAAALFATSVAAAAGSAHAQTAPAASPAMAPMSMSQGEIKAVDKDAGKLTIKHGELANLGMPGMTMVFRVRDPALLNQVKVGDRIDFVAEKVDGALTVTTLRAAH